jgi:hypothetical protein
MRHMAGEIDEDIWEGTMTRRSADPAPVAAPIGSHAQAPLFIPLLATVSNMFIQPLSRGISPSPSTQPCPHVLLLPSLHLRAPDFPQRHCRLGAKRVFHSRMLADPARFHHLVTGGHNWRKHPTAGHPRQHELLRNPA